jgi:type I restriction enzyme S subunit
MKQVPGDRQVPWIGNPAAFTPLKYVCDLNREVLDDDTPEGYEMRYLDISAVDANGGFDEPTTISFAQAPSRARRRVSDDNVIVSTVRTYLTAIAHVRKAGDNLICSTGFTVIRCGQTVVPRFLFYWLRSTQFVSAIVSRSVGVSYPAINPNEIAQLPLPLIGRDEQRAIASFLDRETAKIDDLIAKKGRLLDLLSLGRSSVTFRLVTGGNSTKPKRLSADPRLPPIPKHWTPEKLGYLARLISGGTPSKENVTFWNGEIPWFSAKDMKTQYLEDSEDHISGEALETAGLQRVPPSTVLIVVRGMILAHSLPVGLLRVPATFNQDIKALCFNSRCHPEFMLAWFQGMASLLHPLVEESAHGTRCLRTDLLKNVVCHLPPLEEQREIVAELDANLAKFDEVSRPITAAIALLREYRSALVSAAVTGQLDLRQHEMHLEALA